MCNPSTCERERVIFYVPKACKIGVNLEIKCQMINWWVGSLMAIPPHVAKLPNSSNMWVLCRSMLVKHHTLKLVSNIELLLQA